MRISARMMTCGPTGGRAAGSKGVTFLGTLLTGAMFFEVALSCVVLQLPGEALVGQKMSKIAHG